MKVNVNYVIPTVIDIEITTSMIIKLYHKFKNEGELFIRSKIMDTIDDFLREKSGYIRNHGCDFDYLEPLEEFVDEVVDEIEEEEMYGTEEE